MEERAVAVRSNGDFQKRVGEAMSGRHADREPAGHVEQRIYDGFPDRADQGLMERFHKSDWAERSTIATQMADERAAEFARRLIYMEAPEALSDHDRAFMDAWIRDRILTDDPLVPWTTIPRAIQEADDLLAHASGDEADFLTDIRQFLERIADKFRPQ